MFCCFLEADNRECVEVSFRSSCAGRFGKEVVFNEAIQLLLFHCLKPNISLARVYLM